LDKAFLRLALLAASPLIAIVHSRFEFCFAPICNALLY